MQLLSLSMNILSICLAVGSVVVCSRLASRVTRALSRRPPSESTLAKLATDQAELSSSVQSLATTVKRMSSRSAIQERRSAPDANEPPPPGAPKAALRAHFGLKTPSDFVRVHNSKRSA